MLQMGASSAWEISALQPHYLKCCVAWRRLPSHMFFEPLCNVKYQHTPGITRCEGGLRRGMCFLVTASHSLELTPSGARWSSGPLDDVETISRTRPRISNTQGSMVCLQSPKHSLRDAEISKLQTLTSTDVNQTPSMTQLKDRSPTPRNKVFRESRRRQGENRPSCEALPLSSPTLMSRTPPLVSGQRTNKPEGISISARSKIPQSHPTNPSVRGFFVDTAPKLGYSNDAWHIH